MKHSVKKGCRPGRSGCGKAWQRSKALGPKARSAVCRLRRPGSSLAVLAALQKGSLRGTQKEFFETLLALAVEAYASHPAVWSEMGYGGPRYPRGYYRIEAGVTDPWEAKAEVKPT